MRRTDWVDEAKGLGILLVVLGHACVPSLISISKILQKIYLFIYLFHMPVFMYLSGYAFFHFSKKLSFKDFAIKKTKALICPYVIYILAVYLFFWCISFIPPLNHMFGVNVSFNVLDILKDVIICEGALDKHMWYIYLLFFISIIVYGINHNKRIKQILILVSVIIGPILFSMDLLPIYNLLYYLPIFFLGKVDINSYVKKMPSKKKAILVVGYLFFVIFYLKNIQWLKGFGYGLAYIKYIAGYVGILIFFVCLNVISKYFHTILQYIGQRSFIIYLFHQPIVVSGTALVSYKLLHSPIASMIMSTFAGIIAPIILEIVYRKVKDYARKNCEKLYL